MNSRKEKAQLDDLFQYGLAPYRDAQPAPEIKTRVLRIAQQRKNPSEPKIRLYLGLRAHPILRRIAEAFCEEPVPYPVDPGPLVPTSLLNRHILAVRLY